MRIITTDQVKSLPRGRKAEVDETLVKALKTIKAGHFGLLDEFGVVNGKEERAKVAGKIRKAWSVAQNTKCSIKWSPEGYPQVGAASK